MSTYSKREIIRELRGLPDDNVFTNKDHHIVRQALRSLTCNEHSIVMLRFWENCSLAEISKLLDLTWDQVESSLTSALTKLKGLCVRDPDFSKSQPSLRQAA